MLNDGKSKDIIKSPMNKESMNKPAKESMNKANKESMNQPAKESMNKAIKKV